MAGKIPKVTRYFSVYPPSRERAPRPNTKSGIWEKRSRLDPSAWRWRLKVLGGQPSTSSVHDSYAVHATDVDLMGRVLREQFIRVHEEFTLEGFAEGLRGIAPDVEIKAPRTLGSLDIGDVARSEYFFS